MIIRLTHFTEICSCFKGGVSGVINFVELLNITAHTNVHTHAGFLDIRNFTDTTECLQEEVMLKNTDPIKKITELVFKLGRFFQNPFILLNNSTIYLKSLPYFLFFYKLILKIFLIIFRN